MDLYLREGGSNPDCAEKNPDNQSDNRYHRVEVKFTGSDQPKIEPLPSNTGDQFAWSDRAGFNPLNYWLPLTLC